MSYPKIPLAQQVIQLVKAKGINHVVISPGSRNAPLTIGFSNHPEIKSYSIVDERCAAFFAMGIAQKLQEPVAVVCTSGSALLNYYPAIAEAFYTNIPLIVLTADRPKHLIDVGDGQTIRQENVFEKHILYSANLKQDLVVNDERFGKDRDIPSFIIDKLSGIDDKLVNFNQKEINKAINVAITKRGPVHINIPFAEPLYDTQQEFTEKITLLKPDFNIDTVDTTVFKEFIKNWNGANKKMVLVGVKQPNTLDKEVVEFLGNDESTIVFTETTSNIHHANFFPSIDKIIAPLTEEEFIDLQPEVLLTFGGLIVSKKIKAFLRTYKPKYHYHISSVRALDTFFSLTYHFNCRPNYFFNQMIQFVEKTKSTYQSNWLSKKAERADKHQKYLKRQLFSDLKVFENIIESLPNNIGLHLSNSSTIRYMQLFDNNPTIEQYCNRGTSGIDGSTSTAIGHSVVSNKQQVLITGDLSFFYDSNALWNNYIPSNFRIIVINNNGGGIFRILPGNKNTENFETYFETTHNLTAKHLCEMYGITYAHATDEANLKMSLKSFFKDNKQPKLLEVFTPRIINDELLIGYFKHFID
ncbi:2-succinyl-5-enolpyruvyl-6-hydroxy-3-cyclohexene-1-carboxylate synthase [Pseudofulvibacter geojedonensis]|uniref:2-succinyl-5-enolpyruvyl-6-hydroxy-3-cyclohexene-1-carboxylate synthase n=1 Tax=Pseudofulvibacter geojedonensis TaxID=1123758 RepID=A0ABW3I2Q5_9FLAO